ncbi:MAG: GNAT family N-acetyltransferase [Firmicutes bacterium]|nr:GNAT family N-acetyltransferase [Bacillota bacterium]
MKGRKDLVTKRLLISTVSSYEGGDFCFGSHKNAIMTIADESLVGIITTSDFPNGTCDISYKINPAHRGNGYATEALVAETTRKCKENLVPKLVIKMDSLESLCVAKKAGYIKISENKKRGIQEFAPRGIASDIGTRKLMLKRE